ncbi:hypothetical protein SEEN4881_15848, partial [Salmonella enterica subsp. enterica serovar Newport str. WA_14881]
NPAPSTFLAMWRPGRYAFLNTPLTKSLSTSSRRKNHLLTQVLQFIIGEENQDDDLFDCFNYGVALGLGNGEGF